MLILGVDPGIVKTGYGLISINNNTSTLIDYGVISPNSKDTIPSRLLSIYSDVEELINNFKPNVFSIEDVFYSKNFKSAMLLGQARAVAILCAEKYSIPIFEYSAKKVKQSITGNGNSSKVQVQYMVKKMLKIKNDMMPVDSSDALAIALCHLNQLKVSELW